MPGAAQWQRAPLAGYSQRERRKAKVGTEVNVKERQIDGVQMHSHEEMEL